MQDTQLQGVASSVVTHVQAQADAANTFEHEHITQTAQTDLTGQERDHVGRFSTSKKISIRGERTDEQKIKDKKFANISKWKQAAKHNMEKIQEAM